MDLLRSLPLGLYLENPITWLHRLDARVKILWLMGFLLTPILANVIWRVALVFLLIALTLVARVPLRVWQQQMGWLLALCGMVFVIGAIAPDGVAIDYQRRLPSHEILFSQTALNDPPPAPKIQPSDYQYVVFHQGPFRVTRRSLDLTTSVSTLLFTLIYSTNLFLLTTAPEEITEAIETLMLPLRKLNLPVTEVALTLTLSLRFIPLVLEEIQNLVRSVSTRAINWKKLGLRNSLQVWLMVSERLLQNLLLRADQISSAMKVRGFTTPNQHRVQWHKLRFFWGDWIALSFFILFIGSRAIWGWAIQ